jgi:hypothetical protein
MISIIIGRANTGSSRTAAPPLRNGVGLPEVVHNWEGILPVPPLPLSQSVRRRLKEAKPMHDIVVNATIYALKSIRHPRYFESERGYQGQFYHFLYDELQRQGVFSNSGLILEEEHQKSDIPHKTRQRPDIILHIPRKESGAQAFENNVAVWALKLKASAEDASEDFRKLDEMFEYLHYPLGFFVNIDSTAHYKNSYKGNYPDRIVEFTVFLKGEEVVLS